MPRSRRTRQERLGGEPVPARLGRERSLEVRDLRGGLRRGQRDVQVGRAEVAIPLRHLVLEDRRPAEHLPDDLARRAGDPGGRRRGAGARIRSGSSAGVGGDRLLRRHAEERQVAVPEVADVDPLLGDALEEALRARPRLGSTLRDRGGEDEPGDGRVGTLVNEPADGAARADLRVVGVCAGHEDPRPARRRQAERLRHGPHDGVGVGPVDPSPPATVDASAPSHTAHGARPLPVSASRCSSSRSVSSGAQNPSYRVACRAPASISRPNGASTSSSPGSMTSKTSLRSVKYPPLIQKSAIERSDEARDAPVAVGLDDAERVVRRANGRNAAVAVSARNVVDQLGRAARR